MKHLSLTDGFVLAPAERDDQDALVEHLQEREIWRNTLRIPWPYTEAHAEDWIEERIRRRDEQPKETTFAIRRPDGTLIGVVGADDLDVGASHRARIGYWLAKPYWNRGIMTEAVSRYVDYAFTELAVVRLTAEVFAWNTASARVLQKVGFVQEGRLRNHREKDGDLMDVLYFGLLRTDLEDDA
ncbi:MAG: N-acetyltransferase [Bacteroidetes bacterium SW_7_64_58]|nr:MAG: N-acetyltransferase [Bacteroidetes bacterium SW_7_64_58]